MYKLVPFVSLLFLRTVKDISIDQRIDDIKCVLCNFKLGGITLLEIRQEDIMYV